MAAIDPQQAAPALRSGRQLDSHVEGENVQLAPAEVLIRPQPKPGFAITGGPAPQGVATSEDEFDGEKVKLAVVKHGG